MTERSLDELLSQERRQVEPPAGAAERGFERLAQAESSVDLEVTGVRDVLTAGPSYGWLAGLMSLALGLAGLGWFASLPVRPAEPSAPAMYAADSTEPRPSLEQEVASLAVVMSHLEANRLADARSALREHRVRCAPLRLVPETEALQARLDCRSGSSTAAEEFLRVHARSPYVERVKSDCVP